MSNQTPNALGSSPRRRESADNWLKALTSPGFLACAVILVVMTLGFKFMVKSQGIRFTLKPAPLRKELAEFDAKQLTPFNLLRAGDIEINILQQLGTDKYIEWLIADPYDPEGNLVDAATKDGWATMNWPRKIHLFVTYYTGNRDPIPHVPEACYQGSGHQQNRAASDKFKKDDTVDVVINGEAESVPLRVLEFERPGELSDMRRIVMYTFHCNGAFRKGREGVLQATKKSEHLYYSKIELAVDLGGGYRDEADAIQAAKRLLAQAAPVLVSKHFPDWDALCQSTAEETDESVTP